MLSGLFARLTGDKDRGAPLFALAVSQARQRHWFVEGAVPDSVEGRFSVLGSVTALIILRLEQLGGGGEAASVALTERFVEAMDSEVREMGVGDPALGKQVRKLLGSLGARVERFRQVIGEDGDFGDSVVRCLYRDEPPDDTAAAHGARSLRSLWERLSDTDLGQLNEGSLK